MFHRTKQGVVPTEQGDLFFRSSLTLLEHWNEVHKTIHQSTNEIFGRFKVGCHQSVGVYTLPPLLEQLNKHAPGIEIELVHDFSRKITEGIISYNIDIGFVVNPIRHPDLVLKKIGDDKVMFWKKAGLAHTLKTIFADRNLIQTQDILGKTHLREFKGWRVINTHSLELIRALIASGQSIGILPSRALMAHPNQLVPYNSKLPIFEDKLYLAYRRDALTTRAGRELIKHASSEV